MFIFFLVLLLMTPFEHAHADEIQLHLLLTAVAPQEPSDHDWVEIIVADGSGDISHLIVTDLDGTDTPIASTPVTVARGDRIRVHWDAGIDEADGVSDSNNNGVRDFYVSDPGFSMTDDEAVLVFYGALLDAVVFTNNDGSITDSELDDVRSLNTAKQWNGALSQAGAVILGAAGTFIGRVDGLIDTDAAQDWKQYLPGEVVPTTFPVASSGQSGSGATIGTGQATLSASGSSTSINTSNTSLTIFTDVASDSVSPQTTTSRTSATSASAGTTTSVQENISYPRDIALTELLPNPVGDDATGEFIEAKNTGTSSVSLYKWVLEDASGKKYTIPDGITVAAGEYLAFMRSKTNITLNNDAETIRLNDPSGAVVSQIAYDATFKEGVSLAFIDGTWQKTTIPTPNRANEAPPAQTSVSLSNSSTASSGTTTTQSSSTVASNAIAAPLVTYTDLPAPLPNGTSSATQTKTAALSSSSKKTSSSKTTSKSTTSKKTKSTEPVSKLLSELQSTDAESASLFQDSEPSPLIDFSSPIIWFIVAGILAAIGAAAHFFNQRKKISEKEEHDVPIETVDDVADEIVETADDFS